MGVIIMSPTRLTFRKQGQCLNHFSNFYIFVISKKVENSKKNVHWLANEDTYFEQRNEH
jgi:hypothetical protein